jgi:hypothetical protein
MTNQKRVQSNPRDRAIIQIEVVESSGVLGEACWLSLKGYVPSRKPLSVLHEITVALRRYLRAPRHLSHAIWLEIRTAVPRTRLLKSMMSGKACLLFGKVWERHSTRLLQPNTRTSARIRDTQLLMEKFPWASVAEIQFFLEGWNMREKSCKRIEDSCRQQQCVAPSA